MDFTPSPYHYADPRKHSAPCMVQKKKENDQKEHLPKELDMDVANREICPTCPRGCVLPVDPVCKVEVPVDEIKCAPRMGCPPLPRCPACEPLPLKCKDNQEKDPSCPALSGICGAQQQIGQGIPTKK